MTNDPENNLLLIDCVVARILQTMVGMLEPNASILRFNFIGGNDDGCSVAEVGYRMAYNAITGCRHQIPKELLYLPQQWTLVKNYCL